MGRVVAVDNVQRDMWRGSTVTQQDLYQPTSCTGWEGVWHEFEGDSELLHRRVCRWGNNGRNGPFRRLLHVKIKRYL